MHFPSDAGFAVQPLEAQKSGAQEISALLLSAWVCLSAKELKDVPLFCFFFNLLLKWQILQTDVFIYRSPPPPPPPRFSSWSKRQFENCASAATLVCSWQLFFQLSVILAIFLIQNEDIYTLKFCTYVGSYVLSYK